MHQNHWTAIAVAVLEIGNTKSWWHSCFSSSASSLQWDPHMHVDSFILERQEQKWRAISCTCTKNPLKKDYQVLPEKLGGKYFCRTQMCCRYNLPRFKQGWYLVLLIPHWPVTFFPIDRWTQSRNMSETMSFNPGTTKLQQQQWSTLHRSLGPHSFVYFDTHKHMHTELPQPSTTSKQQQQQKPAGKTKTTKSQTL